MTIEFRCTTCGKLLRTQEGTEGKKAKCPQCGTILAIPEMPAVAASLDVPPPRDPEFARPPQAAANPYQSPTTYGQAEAVVRAFHPTRIDFAEVFSQTWQIFKANLGMCMAGTILSMGCNLVIGYIVQLAFLVAIVNLEGAAVVVVWLLQQLVGQGVSAFFYVGLIAFMLRIARGEPAEIGLLFSGGPLFVFAAAIQIIIALATMIGFILLIVPGIIIALMLSQGLFMLVDQRSDIGGSLKLSIEAMKGNKLTVFAIWIAAFFGGILFILLTCFIGLLFFLPFMMLLATVIYLGVTGQKTALGAAPPPIAERGFGAPGVQPT